MLNRDDIPDYMSTMYYSSDSPLITWIILRRILKSMNAPHIDGVMIYVIYPDKAVHDSTPNIYRKVLNSTYKIDEIDSPDPEFKDIKEFLTEDIIKAIMLQYRLGVDV